MAHGLTARLTDQQCHLPGETELQFGPHSGPYVLAALALYVPPCAGMAELVDARASKTRFRKELSVRFRPPAPRLCKDFPIESHCRYNHEESVAVDYLLPTT